jgi:putative Holliday junction resolvase
MALDHGGRRVGVAVSDPTRTIASGRDVIRYADPADLVRRLTEVLAAEEEDGPIVGIVIGDPRHMSGAPSEGSREAAALAARIRATLGLPVWLWDERWSSIEADARLAERGLRGRERRRRVDTVAAALILQSFLESLRPPPAAGDASRRET